MHDLSNIAIASWRSWVLMTIVTLYSCGGASKSNKANILPANLQYSVDTMFSHHRRHIIIEMDSLCQANQKDLVRHLTDSIVILENKRINEISDK